MFDLGEVLPDLTPASIAEGALGEASLALTSGASLPEAPRGERFGPPVARPGKVVCIGLNYRDHAAETGAAVPQEPVVFLKAPETVIGPDDDVLIPVGSQKTDWEVELGVVIGRTCRYAATEQEAMSAVAGYTLSFDVSEREFQLERGGQWDKGKSCETFNPLGPWLVTADEVAGPIGLRCWVNGELRQDGSTADMIFSVPAIVRYVSQFMTLYPGDLINTGTPAGVGLASPQRGYLRPGDSVELEGQRLGRQHHRMVQAVVGAAR